MVQPTAIVTTVVAVQTVQIQVIVIILVVVQVQTIVTANALTLADDAIPLHAPLTPLVVNQALAVMVLLAFLAFN